MLLPQALGADLWFVTGEGPRLSAIAADAEMDALKPADALHDHLAPIYETVKILSRELPPETTLIGFAGAPWTVATYMIAGRRTPDQGPAHALKSGNLPLFERLIDRLADATIGCLGAQIEEGAEVVKIFDSWAGSLQGDDFARYSVEPMRKITAALKTRHPDVPVVAFPRGAVDKYEGLHQAIGAGCIAFDDGVTAAWAPEHVQSGGCVQGNLASSHMVTGGDGLVSETRHIVDTFSKGPYIFNLGHGITPDADPENVQLMIDTVRTAQG